MTRKSAFKIQSSLWRRIKSIIEYIINPRFGIYKFKWYNAPRFKYVLDFPVQLDIESTNTCNLRCIMCPHSNPTKEFNKFLGFMDMGLYRRIIDEGVRNGMSAVKLNWRGEPLMHPQIAEMVRYAKGQGVLEVQINTNGLLLKRGNLTEKLIDSGLDRIIFSMDGIKKETYEKIRVGGKYETLLENIKNFVETRNRKGLKKPLVRVQMVKMDCNKEELEDYIAYWKTIADEITTQDYTFRHEGGGKKLEESLSYTGRLPCPQIWQRMIITWDGKVIMCCRDWESENPIGQLDDKVTLKEIWHGKLLNSIRELHKQRKLNEIPVCEKCSFKESYDWKYK